MSTTEGIIAMTIEKNNKNTLQHEEYGFTTIINETVWHIKHDTGLAIWCYLSTRPANWNICKIHLQKQLGIGRDRLNKGFKYLKDIGAIEITMNRDKEGQCTGWTTVLKRKIAASIQITENPYSGEKRTPVDNSRTRSLKNQNLVKPESGKTAPTKQRCLKKKEDKETKQTPVSVSVFSCSKDVQNHIEFVASMRHIDLTKDQVSQVLFYIGDTFDFNAVTKAINIAFKLIREGRWNIPHGWNGVTSKSIKDKEDKYMRDKEIQKVEEEKTARNIRKEMMERNIIAPQINLSEEHPKKPFQATAGYLKFRAEANRALGIECGSGG